MIVDPKTFTFSAVERSTILSGLHRELAYKDARLTKKLTPAVRDLVETQKARLEDLITRLEA